MDTKQCKGCVFWVTLSGFSTEKCCNHLAATGRMRKRNGDVCLSRTTKAIPIDPVARSIVLAYGVNSGYITNEE